jgi:hypothetical protein
METNVKEVKAWARYLAGFYGILLDTDTPMIPNGGCPRALAAGAACGTCRSCQARLVVMVLCTAEVAAGPDLTGAKELTGRAEQIVTDLFQYTALLDPSVRNPRDSEAYIRLTIAQMRQLLIWTADIPRNTEGQLLMLHSKVSDQPAVFRWANQLDAETWWLSGEHAADPCSCDHQIGVHRIDLGCVFCDCTAGRVPESTAIPSFAEAVAASGVIHR